MEKYNYYEQVKSDIKELLENEIDFTDFTSREDLEEYLTEKAFNSDSVTGNISGSYFCNAWKAEEALCHNWDLAKEACEEFECDYKALEKGPEWLDVTIRCYLVYSVLSEILDEMENEGKLNF